MEPATYNSAAKQVRANTASEAFMEINEKPAPKVVKELSVKKQSVVNQIFEDLRSSDMSIIKTIETEVRKVNKKNSQHAIEVWGKTYYITREPKVEGKESTFKVSKIGQELGSGGCAIVYKLSSMNPSDKAKAVKIATFKE